MNLKSAAVLAIYKRELSSYFASSIAWVFLVIYLVLQAFFTFFVSRLYEGGQADLRPFFDWQPWIFLFLVPAVSMRLWSEERRLGTLELLLTFPTTLGQVIAAKFLAAWTFLLLSLALTFPVVITVVYLGDPDIPAILLSYFGCVLMAGGFLGVGLLMSSLTRSQVISFVLAVTVCFFLVLAGYPPVTEGVANWAPEWLVAAISGTSFLTHFTGFSRGILDFRDVFYYLSVMLFCLAANGVVLTNRKS